MYSILLWSLLGTDAPANALSEADRRSFAKDCRALYEFIGLLTICCIQSLRERRANLQNEFRWAYVLGHTFWTSVYTYSKLSES